MSEKRYYWLKLQKDFFKRHDIKYIQTLPDGYLIAFFYLKLMVESVDHDGELRFSPEIPYSEAMLASVTDTPVEIVTEGMKTLKELGMVIIDDNGTISIPKVIKMIGSASDTDGARRVRRYREKQQALQNVTSPLQNVTDAVTNDNESKSKSKSKSKSESIERNTKESGVVVPFPLEDFNSAPQVLSDEEVLFNQFWTVYPKKVDKKGSFRAFKNIPKLKEVFPGIMSALEIQKRSEQWTKQNGQFIPNPTTYIHQERWTTVRETDELQTRIDDIVKQNIDGFLV